MFKKKSNRQPRKRGKSESKSDYEKYLKCFYFGLYPPAPMTMDEFNSKHQLWTENTEENYEEYLSCFYDNYYSNLNKIIDRTSRNYSKIEDGVCGDQLKKIYHDLLYKKNNFVNFFQSKFFAMNHKIDKDAMDLSVQDEIFTQEFNSDKEIELSEKISLEEVFKKQLAKNIRVRRNPWKKLLSSLERKKFKNSRVNLARDIQLGSPFFEDDINSFGNIDNNESGSIHRLNINENIFVNPDYVSIGISKSMISSQKVMRKFK
ncbi:MAG: hypothetical protein PUB18_03365 [bacterium]|nr:hypothetical protein [bacterium]